MKKLAVCGATGTQGGSLIEVMKDLNDWELHAFSRHTNSDGATSLKNKGANVYQADLLDLESLIEVFNGADCVFGVTQPWNKSYTKCDTNLTTQLMRLMISVICLLRSINYSPRQGEFYATDKREYFR